MVRLGASGRGSRRSRLGPKEWLEGGDENALIAEFVRLENEEPREYWTSVAEAESATERALLECADDRDLEEQLWRDSRAYALPAHRIMPVPSVGPRPEAPVPSEHPDAPVRLVWSCAEDDPDREPSGPYGLRVDVAASRPADDSDLGDGRQRDYLA